MHLVDTTLFYSPTSGGVKRYLSAKHAWLSAHTSWEHTIVVPGVRGEIERGGICTLPGYPVPGTFNYRLPLNPRRWVRLSHALEPTLIEAGDAFHPAWCAWRVAQRRGIALAAFLSLQPAADHRPALRRRVDGAGDAALPALAVRALRCGIRAEPPDVRVPEATSACARDAAAARGGRAGVQPAAPWPTRCASASDSPANARVLIYAGRFAQEKNLPVLLQAFARLGSRRIICS